MAFLRLIALVILAVIAQACSNPDPETISDSEMVAIARALVERSEAMRDSDYEKLGDRCSIGFGARFEPDGEQTVTLAVRTYNPDNPDVLYQALSGKIGPSSSTSDYEAAWVNLAFGGVGSILLSAETLLTWGTDEVSTTFVAESGTDGDVMRTAVGDSLRSLVKGLVVSNAASLGCSEPNP